MKLSFHIFINSYYSNCYKNKYIVAHRRKLPGRKAAQTAARRRKPPGLPAATF